jgi:hypothetical protein
MEIAVNWRVINCRRFRSMTEQDSKLVLQELKENVYYIETFDLEYYIYIYIYIYGRRLNPFILKSIVKIVLL